MAVLGNIFLQNVFSFLLVVFAAIPSDGSTTEARAIPREVIALYDGLSTESVDDLQLHRVAEFPLNHLGLKVRYWNIADGLPDLTQRQPAYVVTWFESPIADPARFLEWAILARDSGTRFAILGQTGLPEDEDRAFLALLGLDVRGFAQITHQSRITRSDPALIGFECAPDPVLPPYAVFKPRSADVAVHLAVTSDAPGAGGDSALVSTSPAGGVVASGFAMCRVPGINRIRWLINPFTFFERAFGLPPRPIPDTTTLSGRRIYFSHIDGDGWGNRSEIAIGGERHPLAGQVLAERLFKAYPDLPLGLGLVGGELDDALGPVADRAVPLAREVLALPNVEVAAHGYSHPIRWGDLVGYDREAEVATIDSLRAKNAKTPILRGLDWIGQRLDKTPTDLRYFDGELPRVFLARPFSLDNEIADALARASELAPEGKPAKTFYWTGDARPFPEALAKARALGVGNMNGGDGRFDGLYPSVAYLSPLARSVGGERQIFSGAANEVLFTDGWSRHFHGQIRMADMVARTGSPRRLKPFNLYYHTYSGEKHASMQSLTQLHELAADEAFIPVWPSRYIAAANGFFDAKISRIAPDTWQIENRGGLQTLRFDTTDPIHIDTHASLGVVGLRRVGASVYIALDPAQPVVRLRLGDRPDGGLLLDNSNWELSGVRREVCGFDAEATGFGPGDLTFTGAERGPWYLTAKRGEEPLAKLVAHSTGNSLRFKLPDDIRAPLSLEIRCKSEASE